LQKAYGNPFCVTVKQVISCDVENKRSINTAEKSGYTREGTLIQDCIENGTFRDSAVFGKIIS
jgi:RimJ/RimL family protein N-acetyltransferase